MFSPQDYKFGSISENKNLPILAEFFKQSLIKDNYKFGTLDYYNEDKSLYIELKTRRISKTAYSTTVLSAKKIERMKTEDNANRKCIFVFEYTDGLFYIEYSDELFSTFRVGEELLKRGYKEKVYYIPIKELKEIKVNIQLQ
jgi:hypothetical protein